MLPTPPHQTEHMVKSSFLAFQMRSMPFHENAVTKIFNYKVNIQSQRLQTPHSYIKVCMFTT